MIRFWSNISLFLRLVLTKQKALFHFSLRNFLLLEKWPQLKRIFCQIFSIWVHSTQQALSQCSPVSLAAVLILTKSKTQLRLFPGQTNENKYPSEGVFLSSQGQGQKMRYVWAKSKRFDFFLNPPEKSSLTLHSRQALRSSKLSWGCFQAKPLKISTLVMELFF